MVYQKCISWHCEFSLHSFSEESSVEGSWMLRNDTLQTPGPLQTPQLTSTVLRENRPAEHMPDPDSEPGSENDYVHKSVHASSSVICYIHMHTVMIYINLWIIVVGQPYCKSKYQNWYESGVCLPRVCLQSSDADVVVKPTKDGGGEQERSNGHELHQVTQQSGCPADCVSLFVCLIVSIYGSSLQTTV